MAKQFTVSFPLTLFHGASNAEARQFVQEALMRMASDLRRTARSDEDKAVLKQIEIPTTNQIEVSHG